MKKSIALIVLALAVALVGGTTTAGAKKKVQKATLHITVPSSVADGASWSIQARGRSGPYNHLAFHAYYGTTACEPTEGAEEFIGKLPTQTPLSKDHGFNKSSAYVAGNPGTHTACVYLYKLSAVGGHQLMRSATYTVTP
jgi:hypothetical protein